MASIQAKGDFRMTVVSERLARAMQLRNKKQVDLARETGIGKSSICTYLSGEYEPKQANAYKLAAALRVDPAWLMGQDVPMEPAAARTLPHPDLLPVRRKRIRMLGRIAAGEPIYADEERESYVSVDGDLECDFALRVTGDSMSPRLLDGDVVFFREQDDVNDGQIAAVIIDDCATLKHVYHLPGGIQLVSENPKYPPMIFDAQNSTYARILGLAVGYHRKLD